MRHTLRFGQLLFHRAQHKEPSRLTGKSVWLIYCWGATRGTMADLEHRLAIDGYAPHTPHLRGFMGLVNIRGIDELAREILAAIQKLSRESKETRIAVIGHSIGGIVGRYLVSALGGDAFIDRLILLGSPNRGSAHAHVGSLTPFGWFSPGLRQLSPRSAIMTTLFDHPIPQSVACTNIYSEDDHIVPPTSATLSSVDHGDHIHDVAVRKVGHHESVTNPHVYDVIREALAGRSITHEDLPRSLR